MIRMNFKRSGFYICKFHVSLGFEFEPQQGLTRIRLESKVIKLNSSSNGLINVHFHRKKLKKKSLKKERINQI